MITVITAFIIDFIIGDPRTTLHPVARMGAFISMLERLFYNEKIVEVGAFHLRRPVGIHHPVIFL